jgi:hypothetical protein
MSYPGRENTDNSQSVWPSDLKKANVRKQRQICESNCITLNGINAGAMCNIQCYQIWPNN